MFGLGSSSNGIQLGQLIGMMTSMREELARQYGTLNDQISGLRQDIKEIDQRATDAAQVGQQHSGEIAKIEHELGTISEKVHRIEENTIRNEPYWGLIRKYAPVLMIIGVLASTAGMYFVKLYVDSAFKAISVVTEREIRSERENRERLR